MKEDKYVVYIGRRSTKTYIMILDLINKGFTPEQINIQLFATEHFKKAFEKQYNEFKKNATS
jgi:hypothetical protein